MGMIYKRGKVFWVKYYSSGKPIRESSHSAKESDAKRLLRDREGRVEMGVPILPKVQRTTVDILLEDFEGALPDHGATDFTRSRNTTHPVDSVLRGPTCRGD